MTKTNVEVKSIQEMATFDLNTRSGRIKAHNAKAVAGVGLKDVKDSIIEAEAIYVYPTTSEENGDVTATAIFGTDGVIYGGISASAAENAIELIENFNVFAEDGVLKIKVVEGKSNAGRTYLTLGIAE